MHFLGGLRSTRGLPLLGSAASHPLARRRHLPQNAQWLVRTLQPTATVHTPQVGFPQLRERLSMSSPKTTNLEQAKKFRSMRGGEMSSTGHEPVYHAAHARQSASLSVTGARLRGLFCACTIESPKNAGVLALVEHDQLEQGLLSR